MKVLVIVALFAFVAVQVCQSAPVPEDDKVEAEKKVEAVSTAPAAESTNSPAPVVVTGEVKTEAPSADAVVKGVEAASTPAEEKKE